MFINFDNYENSFSYRDAEKFFKTNSVTSYTLNTNSLVGPDFAGCCNQAFERFGKST